MTLDPEVVHIINSLWVFVAATLCFLLQAGFGLLEAGSVRSKNAQNIMIKNLMDAAVSAIAYWAIGFAFAFGEGGNPFIGTSYFFLKDAEDYYIIWFFHFVFAGTTATIVSGAVAERCRFRAYLIYSFALTGFIYPVVAHWNWHPDGFFYGKVLDYAGGGAVHGVGGAAAWSASYFLGPRIGKFVKNEETGKIETKHIPGHNLVLAALGGFILWFGFFPFNAGSSGDITDVDTVGRVVVVTTLAGASGSFTLLLFGQWRYGHWDMMMALNGLLAGMVSTCSGVAYYDPWVAIIVGLTGALVYYGQINLFEYVLHIDDPLGASALHFGAGFYGMILVGFLGNPKYLGDDEDLAGIFYGGNGTQLGWQLTAFATYFSWAFGTCSIMFFTLNRLGWFRVNAEVERMGMDIHHHGGHAYRLGSMLQDQSISLAAHEVKNEIDETEDLEVDDIEKNASIRTTNKRAQKEEEERQILETISKTLRRSTRSLIARRDSSSYALSPGAF